MGHCERTRTHNGSISVDFKSESEVQRRPRTAFLFGLNFSIHFECGCDLRIFIVTEFGTEASVRGRQRGMERELTRRKCDQTFQLCKLMRFDYTILIMYASLLLHSLRTQRVVIRQSLRIFVYRFSVFVLFVFGFFVYFATPRSTGDVRI